MTNHLCRRGNSSHDDAYYPRCCIENKLSMISLDDRSVPLQEVLSSAEIVPGSTSMGANGPPL